LKDTFLCQKRKTNKKKFKNHKNQPTKKQEKTNKETTNKQINKKLTPIRYMDVNEIFRETSLVQLLIITGTK